MDPQRSSNDLPFPAVVDGPEKVYGAVAFYLIKPTWVEDGRASTCFLCMNNFSQLRRKHHCRVCGNVLCSKCCNNKIPLPLYSLEDFQRACNRCMPISQLTALARSPNLSNKLESVAGLCKAARNPATFKSFVELGGIQTLVWLAKERGMTLQKEIVSGIHFLTTESFLMDTLVKSGAIEALTNIISSDDVTVAVATEGAGALMAFCRLPQYKTHALHEGIIMAIQRMFSMPSPIPLLAMRILYLVTDDGATHVAIIRNTALTTSIFKCVNGSDPQLELTSLKVLTRLSLTSEDFRSQILKDDFMHGRNLFKLLQRKAEKPTDVVKAACALIGNLACGQNNQAPLEDFIPLVLETLSAYSAHGDILFECTRTVSNMAKYSSPSNSTLLCSCLPDILSSCLNSSRVDLTRQGMRCVLNLLLLNPGLTSEIICREGPNHFLIALGSNSSFREAVNAFIEKEELIVSKPA